MPCDIRIAQCQRQTVQFVDYTIDVDLVKFSSYESECFGILSTVRISTSRATTASFNLDFGLDQDLRFYMFEPPNLGFVVSDNASIASSQISLDLSFHEV